jgi:glyoxylase-like metal-dependent hydrolase (beta-lactamase superfamily II)
MILPAAFAGAANACNAQENVMQITTRTIRPDIAVFAGFANGNVLALVADSGILLVDAQSLKRVAALDTALRAFSTRPVRLIVNTHYHEDHTAGNAFYRERGAAVLAHAQVSVQGARDTTIAELEWHRTALPQLAMPTRSFSDSVQFNFGKERVVVWHPGKAHTDGDAMLWLPDANIIHVGDVFEVGAPPFIDWWVGGSMDGMLAACDKVLALINDRTIIVPGHGAFVTKADLRAYREMLATIQTRIRSGIAKGDTRDAIEGYALNGFESTLGGSANAQRSFVRQLYAGLTR